MTFSCKKKNYRSSGHTPKFINCHHLKLQRNFYTFIGLKLQKTNCFNISNEILERTAFFSSGIILHEIPHEEKKNPKIKSILK